MSGLGGAAGPPAADPELLARMAGSLRWVDDARVDTWREPGVGLLRVAADSLCPAPQPVRSADGSRRLLLWGELSDARELRRELAAQGHRFERPDDPAELALALYERDGRDAFAKLDGSFCLAIWDEPARELLLVSDRFSSRPLFWATPREGLVFGSQVSTVLACADVPRDLDLLSVRELFHFQRVLATRTLNRATALLPPASVLRWREGRVDSSSYWEMDYRPEPRSRAVWAEEMAETFRRSTARVTRSDHRYGLFLSGGLDARMVVAASPRPLHCYHFNDSRNQEYEKAQRIASVRGFELSYLQRPESHYTDLFEAAVEIGSGMYAFNHGHAIGFLPGLREDCDVVLHGFAPELYFRGTNLPHSHRSFVGKRWQTIVDPDLTPTNLVPKIAAKLKYSQKPLEPAQVFCHRFAAGHDEILFEAVRELVEEAARHSDDLYDQFLWSDTRYHCKFPSFLLESSIRSFVGERSIVFDNDVLDLHLRMPVAMRADDRVWNRAVRRLCPGVAAVPDANTGHSLFLPEPVRIGLDFGSWLLRTTGLQRPPSRQPGHATGSWPKFREHIQHDPKLARLIADTIDDPRRIDPGLFDVPRLREMLAEHMSGAVDWRKTLFLVATFGRWHERFGPASV